MGGPGLFCQCAVFPAFIVTPLVVRWAALLPGAPVRAQMRPDFVFGARLWCLGAGRARGMAIGRSPQMWPVG